MVPRQSQSDIYIRNAEGVVVTLGMPQWYPGSLNPMQVCVLAVMISWVPLGSTLGDNDPFYITNVHVGLGLPGYMYH